MEANATEDKVTESWASETRNRIVAKSVMDVGSGTLFVPSYTDVYSNSTSNETTVTRLECILRNAEGNPMVNMTIPVTTFTICLLGNLFAIVFLWKSNQRSDNKQHIFYTLVMTLACCDFVSAILTSPLTFVAYMSGRCVTELGGVALCRYSGFTMIFFGIGSVAIVFAMSLERFIAIRYTMFYQRTMTTHKTRVFLIVIMIGLIILSSLPLLGFGDVAQQFPGSWCFLDWKSRDPHHQGFNFLVACLGILLMLATIICNLIVVGTVTAARRRMKDRNSSHNLVSKSKRKKMAQQENQMMVLLGVMTTVFVVCYLPILLRIIVNQVLSIYSEEFAKTNLSSWDLFAVRMASINPIIDPWVYILCRRSILTKSFRILKLLFLCRCDKGEFQEICLSSREFRRRRSTMSQRSVTSGVARMASVTNTNGRKSSPNATQAKYHSTYKESVPLSNREDEKICATSGDKALWGNCTDKSEADAILKKSEMNKQMPIP
ncbi:prostaglandin E2 receptor EP4 subtype-like isoform X1 [Styela clava]